MKRCIILSYEAHGTCMHNPFLASKFENTKCWCLNRNAMDIFIWTSFPEIAPIPLQSPIIVFIYIYNYYYLHVHISKQSDCGIFAKNIVIEICWNTQTNASFTAAYKHSPYPPPPLHPPPTHHHFFLCKWCHRPQKCLQYNNPEPVLSA